MIIYLVKPILNYYEKWSPTLLKNTGLKTGSHPDILSIMDLFLFEISNTFLKIYKFSIKLSTISADLVMKILSVTLMKIYAMTEYVSNSLSLIS